VEKRGLTGVFFRLTRKKESSNKKGKKAPVEEHKRRREVQGFSTREPIRKERGVIG